MNEASSTRTLSAEAPFRPARSLPFEFSATGGEYFRIWIVNLLLTILTLGIYSAWAKVRRLRYFYGNTRLDGTTFDYHARPVAILKGRLIATSAYGLFYILSQFFPLAALGFIPLFVFGVPWIIMKSRRFQMRMTSYRGIRFGFDGDYRGALKAYIGAPILAALTLYLLGGRMIWERVRYLLGSSRYGTEPARFTTDRGAFQRIFLISSGLFLVVVLAAVGTLGYLIAAGGAGNDPEQVVESMLSPTAVGTFLILTLAYTAVLAYYQKSYLNASFGGLELGPHRVDSHLETGPLFLLYLSNFILILLTLGLYSPWAKVRQMKYQMSSLTLVARGDLDEFAAAAGDGTDAIGEEIGDFFEIDFGL